MKKLAIIVLNYNDSENTLRLVKDYEKMKMVDRIIVVDNQSSDNSYSKIKVLNSKKVDVIKTNENKGYAYGNNYGIKYLEDNYGNFEYISISNPDIYINEEDIKGCVSFLDKHNNVAICAPKMIMRNGLEHPISGWQLRSIRGDMWDSSILLTRIVKRSHIEMYPSEYMKQKEIKVDCVAGSFFIIRNTVLKEVNYFDEKTFLYFEEDILGNKIKKLGYDNYILNDYHFTHMESVSVDSSMPSYKKYMNLQKSKIYYHKTYNDNCSFIKLLFLIVVTYTHFIEVFGYKLFKALKFFIMHFVYFLLKTIALLFTIILLPYTYLSRLFRRNKKIMYYSVVDWKWIKQRPHFVPLFFSENGFKVDYVFDDLYEKYKNKDNANSVVKNEVESNLRVKPYRFFPWGTRLFRLNRVIYLFRTVLINHDIVIFTHPKQVNMLFKILFKIKFIKVYYECMDNLAYWESEDNKKQFYKNETWLVKNSKNIIVSSEGLKQLIYKTYNCPKNKIILIRNGYDKSIFEKIEKSKLELKHPNACYIGTIDDWFDFDVIIDYARKNRNKYFYIIGPVGISVKEKVEKINEKNIIFVGPIEHKFVPDTIKQSDVMLMPFILNDLIEDVDPVKAYEYIYMKRPIVSSYWKELDQFKDFMLYYKNKNDFSKVLDKAFTKKILEDDNYKKLMKESCWDERLKEYLKTIKK